MAVFDLIASHESRKPGLELVELLLQLKMDIVTVMAGMAFFAVQRGDVDARKLPEKVAGLIAAVLRLSNTNVLAFNDSAVLSSEAKSQTDNVRHLLIALIDDPRVAVVKLAERLVPCAMPRMAIVPCATLPRAKRWSSSRRLLAV